MLQLKTKGCLTIGRPFVILTKVSGHKLNEI
jgi:hypothetical protein